jgi:type IV pilus assembly protein PilQ
MTRLLSRSRIVTTWVVVTAAICCPLQAAPEESDQARPTVELTDEGLLEIHARNADLDTMFRMLSAQGGYNIIAGPEVEGSVTADLYAVTMTEALDAILKANGLSARVVGKFIYVDTVDRLAELFEPPTPLVSRVFTLHYIAAVEAQDLVKPLLSKDGAIAATASAERGVESNNADAGGDSLALADTLVVIDYADRIKQIEKVLKQVDVRPKQVLIEATILRASLNDQNDMGIDFNILSGVDFEMLSSNSPGVTDITTGQVPGPQLQNTSMTIRTDFNSQVPGGGFTFGIIKDQVAFFIRALEQITDVTVLANPKILAINKQRGEVIVGRRDGYLTTTVTETTAVQTVEFLETGTQLVFRPFIGDDGYVRMELHPEDSNGGLTPANLPFEETTEATTNVMVRDGHTIMIGGLFRERTSVTRAQVPLLGSIPVGNLLFRRSADTSTREEVIILLTVHIVKDTPEEDQAYRELLEAAERIRVGARRGVMAIGRERLAQMHYQHATEQLAEGEVDQALFNVRLALYLQPRMLAARTLKESLLERRDWEQTSGRMRTFIYDLIANEHGRPADQFGIPQPVLPPTDKTEPTPESLQEAESP